MAIDQHPKLLILETSGRVGQVAVARGDTLLGQRALSETRRHARDLAPAVAELLKEQGWRSRDLDGVLVSQGPGSYTGLRVGIMAAKTLAYATGCAILGLEIFAVVARQSSGSNLVDVLGDAQQEKVYVQRFARGENDAWQPIAPLGIQAFPDWLANRESTACVSGPGLDLYRQRLPAGVSVADASCWHPRLETMLRIGLERFQAGERDSLWKLEPLYARPSSAEEKWQGSPGQSGIC